MCVLSPHLCSERARCVCCVVSCGSVWHVSCCRVCRVCVCFRSILWISAELSSTLTEWLKNISHLGDIAQGLVCPVVVRLTWVRFIGTARQLVHCSGWLNSDSNDFQFVQITRDTCCWIHCQAIGPRPKAIGNYRIFNLQTIRFINIDHEEFN